MDEGLSLIEDVAAEVCHRALVAVVVVSLPEAAVSLVRI
jgi:hypothetical protein